MLLVWHRRPPFWHNPQRSHRDPVSAHCWLRRATTSGQPAHMVSVGARRRGHAAGGSKRPFRRSAVATFQLPFVPQSRNGRTAATTQSPMPSPAGCVRIATSLLAANRHVDEHVRMASAHQVIEPAATRQASQQVMFSVCHKTARSVYVAFSQEVTSVWGSGISSRSRSALDR